MAGMIDLRVTGLIDQREQARHREAAYLLLGARFTAHVDDLDKQIALLDPTKVPRDSVLDIAYAILDGRLEWPTT